MNKLLGLSVVAIGMAFSVARADSNYSGTIRPLWWGNGLYIDVSDANISSPPACATRKLVRLIETDANDPIFKAKYAILLANYMMGKPTSLSGNGTCTYEGDKIIYVVQP